MLQLLDVCAKPGRKYVLMCAYKGGVLNNLSLRCIDMGIVTTMMQNNISFPLLPSKGLKNDREAMWQSNTHDSIQTVLIPV